MDLSRSGMIPLDGALGYGFMVESVMWRGMIFLYQNLRRVVPPLTKFKPLGILVYVHDTLADLGPSYRSSVNAHSLTHAGTFSLNLD